MRCVHCQRNKAVRPRGMCAGCYYSPAVRALYPSTSKYRSLGEPQEPARLPRPTSAAPGTRSKLRVLMRRFRSGLQLWHPRDNPDLPEMIEERLAALGRGAVVG